MASQYYFGQSGVDITRSQLRSFKRQYRAYRRTQFKEYQRTHQILLTSVNCSSTLNHYTN